jgi:hypothetical protein
MKKFVLKKNQGLRPQNKPKNKPKLQESIVVVEKKTRTRNRTRKNRLRRNRLTLNDQINRVPIVRRQRNNRNRAFYSQDEFIMDVHGSTNFAVGASLAINPGQATTFPWLSTIANRYEKYRFVKLRFYYKPMVTQYTANYNTGKVMMNCDYDASDPGPTSKQQVEDSEPHVDGMPYQSFSFALDPREMNGMTSDAHYVRPGGLPGGTDIKTYDVGNLFLSTVGQTDTGLIGELHVEYDIELSVPILDNNDQAPANNSVLFCDGSTTTALTSTVAKQLPLDVVSNGIGSTVSADSFTLSPGNYTISWTFRCTSTLQSLITIISNLYDVTNSTAVSFDVSNSANAYLGDYWSQTGVWYLRVSTTTSYAITGAAYFATGTVTGQASLLVHSV